MSSLPCIHALWNLVLQLFSLRAIIYFFTSLNLVDLVICFSYETVANVMQAEAWKVFVLLLYLEPWGYPVSKPGLARWRMRGHVEKSNQQPAKQQISEATEWGYQSQLTVDTWVSLAKINRGNTQLNTTQIPDPLNYELINSNHLKPLHFVMAYYAAYANWYSAQVSTFLFMQSI